MKKFSVIILLFFVSITFLNAKNSDSLRIVSLTPSVTKQLIALGIKKNIVGCTRFSPIANDKNISVIGGVSNINLEAIVRLSPTFVFANSLTPENIIYKLKSLKIRVVVFKYPESIKDIFDSLLKLGKITGKEERAKKIVKISEKKLKFIEDEAKKYPPEKVFFIIGSKPLYTTPKGTYIDDIIEKINGINIAKNLSTGLVSREFVLKKNPDVILIMDMGKIAREEVDYWKKYKNLNAVKKKKIFILNADRLGSPCLPDLIDLMEEIMKMVH